MTAVATGVLYVWALVGVGMHVFVAFIAHKAREDTDDAIGHAFFSLFAVAATGLIVPAVFLLGYPTFSQWAWLASGTVILLAAIWENARAGLSGHVRAIAVGNIAVGLLILGLGVLAPPLSVAPAPAVVSPAAATVSTPTSVVIDGVRLWHGLALGMLALGTVAFLVLFVRMIERGVSPQIESHWGGIGGGLGGWRMSSSLTYLTAAVVFGILFALFVLRLEPAPVAPGRSPTSPAVPSGPARPPSEPAKGPGEPPKTAVDGPKVPAEPARPPAAGGPGPSGTPTKETDKAR